MIIDCHGHYTTAPPALARWRANQVEGTELPQPVFSDDEIRETIERNQARVQRSRGIGRTIFSPRAASMGHHEAPAAANEAWARVCNDLIHRVTRLFPGEFAGVCQLPQAPGAPPAGSVPELRRCVEELGFVGCNLNPDPSGGHWSGPPLTDPAWYPLYEAMVELDVPAMVHVSASCNPNFHTTGAHYLNGDTAVFMQLLTGDLFRDFPGLKFVIPHGGGAVPYHWGRFRGLAANLGKPPLTEHLLRNVFFDTCVYHQAGIDLLTKVIPAENILFASETLGAVNGTDPESGHEFDDTRRYVEAAALEDKARQRIFEDNAHRVYARLDRTTQEQTT
ncbi:amidohydrolase [Amycolatopsis acidicola]|uniref:Amidohydrolase n=1 Tax=Amycolatopsis acidicola TaxID=2596893 RepID=A0A5N0UNA7_9PSEU|nr:amidohydrolase family protein [Amycolatopsis acidicola]KAA9150730.1 amidohydrolase [Amycolatopsis acidicola]